MSLNPQDLQTLGKMLTTQASKSEVTRKQQEFSEAFQRNQKYAKVQDGPFQNAVDFNAAFTLTALEKPELLSGLNRSILADKNSPKIDGKTVTVGFDQTLDMAEAAGLEVTEAKKNYKRSAGVIDDSTTPGGGNTIQTSLANYIVLRMPQWGAVYNEVNKQSIPDGNLAVPTMIGRPQATFGAAGAPLTNIGSVVEDSTNGIKQVTLTPTQYGVVLPLTNQLIEKINPGLMATITDLTGKAMAYGRDQYILSGTGTTQPLGMITNATSIPFVSGDSMLDSVTKGYGLLASKGIQKSQIRIFINGQTEAVLMRLTYSGANAYIGQIIDWVNRTIFGIPYVVTEAISTTGSAGSQVATMVMGAAGDQYLWGENGDIRILMDPYSAASSLTTNMIAYSFADARPALNDSFVKINITTGT